MLGKHYNKQGEELMSRERTQKYLDIALTSKEVTKLKDGYRVTKKVEKHNLSIFMCDTNARVEKAIAKHQEQIKLLKMYGTTKVLFKEGNKNGKS